ncbi:MAG: DJ-1/PfpI family protein ['Conium maculatum' witches'-broom phytoplasma]|nr:DJ-1/PfpI family protein ['Conium maculatum' witches'-broom phytoplasma]
MKGLLVLYNGFEDCEALVTRALLKKTNLDVTTITLNDFLNVFSSQKLQVKADMYIDQVNYDNYDFLILPGGPYVKKLLDENGRDLQIILDIIKHFADRNKVIGAICAAPSFLGKLNLLENRPFTCYPGYEKYITGDYTSEVPTVVSGNFITSQSPATVFDFAAHLIDKLIV